MSHVRAALIGRSEPYHQHVFGLNLHSQLVAHVAGGATRRWREEEADAEPGAEGEGSMAARRGGRGGKEPRGGGGAAANGPHGCNSGSRSGVSGGVSGSRRACYS